MSVELLLRLKSLSSKHANAAYQIIRRGDKMSLDEMQSTRNKAFVNQVQYCIQYVPFYKKHFAEMGMTAADFQEVNDIRHFPVLTKDMLRNNPSDFLSTELQAMSYSTRRSGGTTGEPIKTYLDQSASSFEVFSYFRGLQWMGWKPGMPLVKIFGGSLGQKVKMSLKDKLLNFSLGSYFIPAFEISKESTSRYMADISRLNDPVLIGYASAIYNLAYYARQIGSVPHNIKLCITTSELLPRDWAEFITETLGCKVRSYYGCGEINSIGYQLSDCDHYVIPDEHLIVESWHGDQKMAPNTLVISQLYNRAQPLMRYVNGDIGVVKPPEKFEGTNKSRIINLYGRSADTFFRKDGTRVSSILGTYSIQRSLIPVRKYQYVQSVLGEVQFLYDPEIDDLTTEHKAEIKRIVDYVMNEPTNVQFVKTNEFITSKNGKHRITVSKLADQMLVK